MGHNTKRGPRRVTRAKDVQLHPHDNSAADARPAKCSVHGPSAIRPLAIIGCAALVEVDGLPMVWDVRGLAWLYAKGLLRCACGRCSEATPQ